MRNKNVTYTKAIGIMLMVLGHCGCAIPYAKQTLYMFHMPLFFFLSGYCFKYNHLDNPGLFLWKRIKGLYWPFIKWGLIFLVLHNVFYNLHIYDDEYGFRNKGSHLYDLEEFAIKAYQVLKMCHIEELLGGFWFLNALFFGSIIAFIFLHISSRFDKKSYCNKKILYIIMLGVSLLAVILLDRTHFLIPWLHLGAQPFLATTFFLSGQAFKEFRIKKFNLCLGVISFIFVFVGGFFWRVQTAEKFYPNSKILPYILTAILGIWCIYSLPWEKLRNHIAAFLLFVGNKTLIILTWHFLSFKLVSLIIIFIYNLSIERLAEFPHISEYADQGWWIVYFVTGVGLPLLFVFIINTTKFVFERKITG